MIDRAEQIVLAHPGMAVGFQSVEGNLSGNCPAKVSKEAALKRSVIYSTFQWRQR